MIPDVVSFTTKNSQTFQQPRQKNEKKNSLPTGDTKCMGVVFKTVFFLKKGIMEILLRESEHAHAMCSLTLSMLS